MKLGLATVLLASSLVALPAFAADKVSFKDPTGDDNGPGTYTYPTDTVYKRGSFDLTGFTLERRGDKLALEVTVATSLEDPWRMGGGFAVQMVFVFIDTDGAPGRGHTVAPPGLNVRFDPAHAWDKLIILSPQSPERVRREIATKAPNLKADILVPARTSGAGNKIRATLDAADLPGDPGQWAYQVVMQSNEGFPTGTDLLTRPVNEYPGKHRFGGGNDGSCDPHVMDLLAGKATGAASEAKAQHAMLQYECADDGSAKKQATLTLVRPASSAKR